MAEIFLSYAKEDRDKARKLSKMLERAGWSVWWDRRIPAGRSWHDILEEALREMRCMVVLWSSHSIDSDWVKEEAEEARARKKLVPVLIEAVNAPMGFRTIQAADLTDWDGVNESFGARQLVADLELLIGKPAPRAALDANLKGSNQQSAGPALRAGAVRAAARSYSELPTAYRRNSFLKTAASWQSIAAAGVVLALGLGAFAFWRAAEPAKEEAAVMTAPLTSADPPPAKIVKLGLYAARRELKPTETMNFALRGVFSDGSENEISNAIEWSSSDSQVAAVDNQGRVIALQPGTTAITAKHGGVTSSAWTLAVKASEPKPSPAPKLVALAVNADKNELWPREKAALRVTGSYSDGSKKNLSDGVVWTSSDTAVASVNAGGDLEAWRAGKTEVVARLGDVTSASVWLMVKESPAKVAAEPKERKGVDYAASKAPVYGAVEKTAEARARPIVPEVNPEQERAKVASYVSRAKDYRVRGDYRAALTELGTARATDPANSEVRAEIEQTRRACLAEKRLGRAGLDCG